MNRVLLVGVTRSGTTWAATVLSKCGDTAFVNEPDDERRFIAAKSAKERLTRYPVIAPGDTGKVGEASIDQYERLWDVVWHPGPARNLIVKSVFVPFCLEWLVEQKEIDHVVWVKRDLRNVVASWYEYSSDVHPELAADEKLVRRLAWQAASHYAAYARLAPDLYTIAVDHLDLVEDPKLFPYIAREIGLEWGHEAKEQLSDLSSYGIGGHYGKDDYSLDDHIHRAREQLGPDAWREKMPDYLMEVALDEFARWEVHYA